MRLEKILRGRDKEGEHVHDPAAPAYLGSPTGSLGGLAATHQTLTHYELRNYHRRCALWNRDFTSPPGSSPHGTTSSRTEVWSSHVTWRLEIRWWKFANQRASSPSQAGKREASPTRSKPNPHPPNPRSQQRQPRDRRLRQRHPSRRPPFRNRHPSFSPTNSQTARPSPCSPLRNPTTSTTQNGKT